MNEKNYSQIDMFGCTEEVLVDKFNRQYNINMYVAGLLSDVQELNLMGKTEEANKLINQVKFYFFEYTDTRNNVPAQKQD
ncbi:hypothetical protein UFOVP1022_18 [uncultured Caudovirales phage]|uniref:Uncharacterized protein n=1 Tax=uncultured Caudovirales phage TaxID=2100421 RepID=A0A6J5S3J5_9CAUD|nr:hypothetical protein UFOVP1022_18 [uncultured Caudovirales phage]CAB4183950.1 hypothetical protein UFOVP1110_23 [uncultured Caudovirales phage]CAB4202569.1 hypothetical protein UFOVP1378_25 [uncultured Caudovirales phage]CAB4215241.1 hypothetical protein UFOVP1474_4 [uncultured Caudovirales phage]CAB5229770.1 hypothetical protein UFOVP1561_9 [uncultured Caudovirales phage]